MRRVVTSLLLYNKCIIFINTTVINETEDPDYKYYMYFLYFSIIHLHVITLI